MLLAEVTPGQRKPVQAPCRWDRWRRRRRWEAGPACTLCQSAFYTEYTPKASPVGAGEVAQQFRAQAAPPEPRFESQHPHGSHNRLWLQFRDPVPCSGSCVPQMCMTLTRILKHSLWTHIVGDDGLD